MDEKLVEKVAKAIMEADSCGVTVAVNERVLCDDPRVSIDVAQCGCRSSARAAISIVLEEAAKVADSAVNKLNGPEKSGMARSIAARIRAMGGEK